MLATFAGGFASVLVAASFDRGVLSRLVKSPVSLSVGVLLGTALNVLPEASRARPASRDAVLTPLCGDSCSSLLKRSSSTRHSHHHEGDHTTHHHHF